jgi:hypothetical protein
MLLRRRRRGGRVHRNRLFRGGVSILEEVRGRSGQWSVGSCQLSVSEESLPILLVLRRRLGMEAVCQDGRGS